MGQQPALSPQVSTGTVILESDEDHWAEETQSVGLSAAYVLSEQDTGEGGRIYRDSQASKELDYRVRNSEGFAAGKGNVTSGVGVS
ncbi:hypothetical protein AXG93_3022s1050 [Marchantia polymorpha subsp. ruderalis]|uniref:Uncharacterized protein n=1 Tax=Marchantia polymorpha subsp. ruderalis TaxID=1480154 RepID=A0A176VEZ2_MARPO|nr:hypothetical protein AXG93_3022s1050 [Marchantia polymorpha subsp. ruderalis]